jgi:hypothetical protein
VAGCNVVDVDGVQIRIIVSHDQRGQTITAIRLLAGGVLYIQSQQGIPALQPDGNPPPDAKTSTQHGQHTISGGWPALPSPPVTLQQVAALAANPGLLP